MTKLNFKGVQGQSDDKFLEPGDIEVFNIDSFVFQEKENYFLATFSCSKGKLKDERFYVAGKTPEASLSALDRLQTLIKEVTGKIVPGDATTDQISTLLTGKKVRLKVSGREGSNGAVYATLPFARFCENVNTQPTKLKFNPTYDIKKYKAPLTTASTSGSYAAPGVVGTEVGKEEDLFS